MNVFVKPEFANSYDYYYESDFGKRVDLIEQDIIDSLIKDVAKTDMVELGCGTGHWTKYFTDKGFNVLGCDISEAMLSIAKNKNIGARFINADSQNLPFENECVQIVASITMLEFVEDQDKTLDEIFRVLKKGGYFVLGALNANSVIGKNKDKDEVFKNAKFLSKEAIKLKLERFGNPQIKVGVYLHPDNTIIENTDDINNTEPIFIGAIVQKN